MPEWLIAAIVCVGTGAFIWWTALTVLVIKGFLFHRQERPLISTVKDSDLPPDDVPSPVRGCVAALVVIFWPMVLGAAIDNWLSKRSDAP
jgi:hypothetical protein